MCILFNEDVSRSAWTPSNVLMNAEGICGDRIEDIALELTGRDWEKSRKMFATKLKYPQAPLCCRKHQPRERGFRRLLSVKPISSQITAKNEIKYSSLGKLFLKLI